MRKLWLVLAVVALFASVSAFASSANYLQCFGGGIIAEQEQLNPVNPAGIQLTNSFAQLELYGTNDSPSATVTNNTGSYNVMFVFPMYVSLKLNDLLAFRLGLFEPAEAAIIPAIVGLTRMGTHAAAVPINVLSPFAISWGMKLGKTIAIGLRYELNTSAQGKWGDDNYSLSYSKHKFRPGIIMNLGNMNLNLLADLNFVALGWSVANTNTTGAFTTNTVTAKSPLEYVGVRGQLTMPLAAKLQFAGNVSAGLGMFGYDEKYNATGGTLTNDVGASLYVVKLMLGLKYSPIEILDTYIDVGTKLYGHNKIDNSVGTVAPFNATNTNVLNQITVPSIAMGILFKPSIFTISLGLSQDIVGSSTPIAVTPILLNNGYELDTSTAVFTAYQGNTVWTMIRTATLGASVNLNPVIVEALVNISINSFLADELKNPLSVFDRIFNNNADMPMLFTGVRVSVLF